MRFSEFQGLPNKAAPHDGPIAVTASATALGSLITLHTATRFVIVRVETAPLRITFDGTAPSSTKGFSYDAGYSLLISKAQAEQAKLIRADTTNAAIQVQQFIG